MAYFAYCETIKDICPSRDARIERLKTAKAILAAERKAEAQSKTFWGILAQGIIGRQLLTDDQREHYEVEIVLN
jgi:hypothetical protein